VDQQLIRRLVIAHVAAIFAIGLAGATAIIALRGTTERVAQARTIDDRLAMLDRLRADTRELGLSARRFILSGDLKEKLRIQAIEADMVSRRALFGPRSPLTNGDVLAATLDDYIASLDTAIGVTNDDTVQRLEQFESQLVRIRAPLSSAFDDVISRERAARANLRSADRLVTIAQWAIGVACGLGLALALGALIAMRRRPPTRPALLGVAAVPSAPPGDRPSLLH
jgi:hypothetical protein